MGGLRSVRRRSWGCQLSKCVLFIVYLFQIHLSICVEPKLLKPNQSYTVGRKDRPLLINNKKVSHSHCDFIVGDHTVNDVVSLPHSPALLPPLSIQIEQPIRDTNTRTPESQQKGQGIVNHSRYKRRRGLSIYQGTAATWRYGLPH